MVPAGPIRTCVGCGKRDAQRALLRLQCDGSGIPTPVGRGATAPGRSAYVHVRPACAAGLLKSKGLARSLRVAVGHAERQRLRACIEDCIRSTELQRAAPEAGSGHDE